MMLEQGGAGMAQEGRMGEWKVAPRSEHECEAQTAWIIIKMIV
jgi:hypothetical protein